MRERVAGDRVREELGSRSERASLAILSGALSE